MMTLQYRIAAEGGVRDVDDSKRQVLVSFPWETIDSYRTDFARDAFDEHLTSMLPVMCWQHQRTEPIGRAREWQKTDKANEFVAGFSDFDAVPRARQAFAQIRDKEITDFSYGFDQAQSQPHPSTRGAIRFTRARMAEISPVTVGSIPGAVAIGIRAEAEVANIRGLVEAGAISEDEAAEMMRAAGVAQPVVPLQQTEPARESITLTQQALALVAAAGGERSITLTVEDDGTVTTSTDSAPGPATDPVAADGSMDVATLASAVDAALDQAADLLSAVDTSGLPDAVQQALALVAAAGVAVDSLLDEMGVPDPDDTDDGGRSAEHLDGSEPNAGERAAVSDKPWSDFSESDYSPAQWKAACLITTDSDAKADQKLPVKEPDGTVNRNAVHAAAGMLAKTQAPPAAKQAAAKALLALYNTTLNEKPPPSLLSAAQGSRAEEDAELEAAAALAALNLRFTA